jgi:uncharacterized DUF497 family protein
MMRVVEFEWDESKARTNWKKHGVTFSEATLVFLDPNRIESRDEGSYGEERYQTIALVDAQVIVLSYTIRENVTRIISARKATKYEREEYWNSQV